jgi:hypothetical protein
MRRAWGGVGEGRFWLMILCVCGREKIVGLTYKISRLRLCVNLFIGLVI